MGCNRNYGNFTRSKHFFDRKIQTRNQLVIRSSQPSVNYSVLREALLLVSSRLVGSIVSSIVGSIVGCMAASGCGWQILAVASCKNTRPRS